MRTLARVVAVVGVITLPVAVYLLASGEARQLLVLVSTLVTTVALAVEATIVRSPAGRGSVLLTRYQRTRDPETLDRATDLLRRGLTWRWATRGMLLATRTALGHARTLRFETSGRREDLEDGIHQFRVVLDTAPATHPNRAGFLSELGEALRVHSVVFDDPGSAEEAVAVAREALDLTPADDPLRPRRLNALGNDLRARYHFGHDPDDIFQARAMYGRAACSLPSSHPDAKRYLDSMLSAEREMLLDDRARSPTDPESPGPPPPPPQIA